MIVFDTCTLIWRAFEPEKLSKKASKSINQSDSLVISSISIWEIGTKIKNKKLSLPISLEEFVARLKRIQKLDIVPVDEMIWMDSLALNWKHKDPADRVIVATARKINYPIVTSDKIIQKFYKKSLW